MIVVTPDDAYALALIARKPALNADLVEELSSQARPIGAALVKSQGGRISGSLNPEIDEMVKRLEAWARGN